MRAPVERPRSFVAGVVVVSKRAAYELERRLDLASLRAETQGKDDEVFDVVSGFYWAARAQAISLERKNPASDGEVEALPSETTPESKVLGADRVADKLGLSRRRVQQLASAGEIEATRVGRTWSFTADAVQAYRERRAA